MLNRSRTLFLIIILSGCALKNEKLSSIDTYVHELHEAGNFDGSIVIGNLNGKIYSKEIGTAVREWSIPVASDTRFDICSLNKSFVGYMIMQLKEASKLSLSDLLASHLEFESQHADQITIHQLLTHTSGLPDYDAMPDSLHENRFEAAKRLHFETDEYINFIETLPIIGKPEEQFYYSNFGYHLLSIIIEKLTGMHFSEALDSMICKPLNMDQTYAAKDNYMIYPRLAKAYDQVEGSFQKSPFIDYSLGRRIFSTSADLYKWGKEVANPTLISNESNNVILTNHIGSINPSVSYGYGWAVFDGGGGLPDGEVGCGKELCSPRGSNRWVSEFACNL